MNTKLKTFEVRVNVKNYGSKQPWYSLGKWVYEETIKTFHVDAIKPSHAAGVCEKHGRPISVRKVSSRIHPNIERLPLLQEHIEIPYESALAMDEMIWKKKKRKQRIQDQIKDK